LGLVAVLAIGKLYAQIPEINFSEVNPSYEIGENIEVIAQVTSNGLVSTLCSIDFEVYKDGELLTNITDYAEISYTIRSSGSNYVTQEITQASGTLAYSSFSAFTLGIFDNYCVNRNRPIKISMTFFEHGTYKLKLTMNQCSNSGNNIWTNYTSNGAPNCPTGTQWDYAATSCNNPTELANYEAELIINPPPTPFIVISDIETSYTANTDINFTAYIYSDGLIDEICSLEYEIWKNGEIIENINNYGTISYTIEEEETSLYTETLISGQGNINFEWEENIYEAFTLGILDNYCVSRNRFIEFNLKFKEPGEYQLKYKINSCSNQATQLETSFIANGEIGCDTEEHYDYIAPICENPNLISEETVLINIDEIIPEIEISGLEHSYYKNDEINATIKLYSNGATDWLCSAEYKIYKDGELIDNLSDYGTINYAIREQGSVIFSDTLTTGNQIMQIEFDNQTIEAFSLGIFDNYCVSRNRPIELSGSFHTSGLYSIEIILHRCSNQGTQLGTSFIANGELACGNDIHFDYIASTCENPTPIITETVILDIRIPVNINSEFTNFALYPNPATNELNIKSSNYEFCEFEIINTVGQVIYNNTFAGNTSIDISYINSGVYFIKLIYNENTEILKFTKQ
ncbi:MAG: T9SS type A sorting domain-containing protein, partial [Bacteroidales bacterium]|nr:T9SS type A sorting domain-containing protein [Bacteroidales bacterium]